MKSIMPRVSGGNRMSAMAFPTIKKMGNSTVNAVEAAPGNGRGLRVAASLPGYHAAGAGLARA